MVLGVNTLFIPGIHLKCLPTTCVYCKKVTLTGKINCDWTRSTQHCTFNPKCNRHNFLEIITSIIRRHGWQQPLPPRQHTFIHIPGNSLSTNSLGLLLSSSRISALTFFLLLQHFQDSLREWSGIKLTASLIPFTVHSKHSLSPTIRLTTHQPSSPPCLPPAHPWACHALHLLHNLQLAMPGQICTIRALLIIKMTGREERSLMPGQAKPVRSTRSLDLCPAMTGTPVQINFLSNWDFVRAKNPK